MKIKTNKYNEISKATAEDLLMAGGTFNHDSETWATTVQLGSWGGVKMCAGDIVEIDGMTFYLAEGDEDYFPDSVEVKEPDTAGYNVNVLRKSTGMSQDRFAETYGIPAATIRNWEQGKSNPPEYVLNMLKRAIETEKTVPMMWVFYGFSDKGNTCFAETFASKEEAIDHANRYWDYLTWREHEYYTKDQAAQCFVGLYEAEWDDVMGDYGYTGDPIVIVWDALA